MNANRFFLILGAGCCALGIAGCETPDARIGKNPQAFSQLSPQQQGMVRGGTVGLGMTMEAVKLALGPPTRVTKVVREGGKATEEWHYVAYGIVEDPYVSGAWRAGRPPVVGEVDYDAPYDRYRVTFTDGRVTEFSQDAEK